MQMLQDWVRVKVWDAVNLKKQEPALVDLDNKPIVLAKDVNEDDVFFHILEVGPEVKTVHIGNIVAISFMANDMFRMKLPSEEFKSFTCRESSVMGILRKQP